MEGYLGTFPPSNLTHLGGFSGVSTDSRTIRPGELFFAIRGPRFDGHDFVQEALSKGAWGAVVEKDLPIRGRLLRVKDTLAALGELAKAHRESLQAKVIAVTGSNGKSTTKEMIAHILSGLAPVTRAKESHNNLIGLPLTILNSNPNARYMVLEIGISLKGEMQKLAEIASPDISVITNISEVHLEGLGSLEEIAKEKGIIIKATRPTGKLILNRDNTWTSRIASGYPGSITFGFSSSSDIQALYYRRENHGLTFILRSGQPFHIPLRGWWNVTNALAAIAVCTSLGVSEAICAERLSTFKPLRMRMEEFTHNGITFINDAYNSNPVSAKNAIEEFTSMQSDRRRVLILGEMRELGKSSRYFHLLLGDLILKHNQIALVICVGQGLWETYQNIKGSKATYFFDSVEQAGPEMKGLLKDGDMVLLKGSRAVGLERILEYL